jgi:hypothetical protein
MGLLRRKVPSHFIPIHSDNTASKDWIIVLEAGTIIGPSPSKLRVARATQERTVVKRYNIFLKPTHYLVVDGFNPRIHAIYFCPQLFRYDPEKRLAPLQGEEIGTVIAQSIEGGVTHRRPWYEPAERVPPERIVDSSALREFDTVIVEMPNVRASSAAG